MLGRMSITKMKSLEVRRVVDMFVKSFGLMTGCAFACNQDLDAKIVLGKQLTTKCKILVV